MGRVLDGGAVGQVNCDRLRLPVHVPGVDHPVGPGLRPGLELIARLRCFQRRDLVDVHAGDVVHGRSHGGAPCDVLGVVAVLQLYAWAGRFSDSTVLRRRRVGVVLIELSRKPDCLVVGAGCALAILLAVLGAVLNLRGLVASEMEAATVEVAGRFEDAAASIRREIRAGTESSDRQLAEIGRFIFELDDLDGDAGGSRD